MDSQAVVIFSRRATGEVRGVIGIRHDEVSSRVANISLSDGNYSSAHRDYENISESESDFLAALKLSERRGLKMVYFGRPLYG